MSDESSTSEFPLLIYQDQYLLMLSKPSGLISTKTQTKEKTLADWVQDRFNIEDRGGGLVHRLDKDTSGLILIAKDADSKSRLQQQFKDREISKEYLALVHGFIKESREISASIMRNPKFHHKFTVAEDTEARGSLTFIRPLKHLVWGGEQLDKLLSGLAKRQIKKLLSLGYDRYTLLSCRPLTGRTHQIRVHLKHINHPIVSDEVYGGKGVDWDKRWCPRLFLHAVKIGFRHPQTGKRMEFESSLPKELEEVLSKLEVFHG